MSPETWAFVTSSPVLVGLTSIVTGVLGVLGTIWVARGRAKVDLESLTQKAVGDIYALAERQRQELERENTRIRTKTETLETEVRDLSKVLHHTQGELDLLKTLRCPLAVTGQCPVFTIEGKNRG